MSGARLDDMPRFSPFEMSNSATGSSRRQWLLQVNIQADKCNISTCRAGWRCQQGAVWTGPAQHTFTIARYLSYSILYKLQSNKQQWAQCLLKQSSNLIWHMSHKGSTTELDGISIASELVSGRDLTLLAPAATHGITALNLFAAVAEATTKLLPPSCGEKRKASMELQAAPLPSGIAATSLGSKRRQSPEPEVGLDYSFSSNTIIMKPSNRAHGLSIMLD